MTKTDLTLLFEYWLRESVFCGHFLREHLKQTLGNPFVGANMLKSFADHVKPMNDTNEAAAVAAICSKILDDVKFWNAVDIVRKNSPST